MVIIHTLNNSFEADRIWLDTLALDPRSTSMRPCLPIPLQSGPWEKSGRVFYAVTALTAHMTDSSSLVIPKESSRLGVTWL